MASERGRALQERQTNHFVSSSNRRSVSRNRLANTGIFLSASSTSEAPGTKGANSLYTAMTSATATIPLFSLPYTQNTHTKQTRTQTLAHNHTQTNTRARSHGGAARGRARPTELRRNHVSGADHPQERSEQIVWTSLCHRTRRQSQK